MGIRGKAKTFLTVILSVALLLGVVSWQKAQAQHKYTAEEVSNLVFNDALYLLRTVFVSSMFTQINNRRYQMDEIFNMVYDDVNHSLRVTVLADSAHEFRALWADTVLARLYATKDGACIYFWMRGVHGDTIAKFEDRNHNVMAYLDSMKEWHASGYDLWTWTAPTPTTKRKIWTRNDTLFWNDSSGVRHSIYPAIPGIGTAPDSAHEWAGAWFDTIYAKHYASKANLALDFFMRGIRGDTLFKFRDRWENVVAWGDTNGNSWWDGRVTARADSADTATFSRFKLIPQGDSIPWCSPIDSWGAKGFITGWYKDSSVVRPPPSNRSIWYGGVSLREKSWAGTGPVRETWSIRVGGYKSPTDSVNERWRYPMAIVDPGIPGATFTKARQRVYWASPFLWMNPDTSCNPDTVAWMDTSGQIHVRGVDLFPQVVAPTDSWKLWASQESLWYNDKVGVFHPIYPSAGGGGSAFGDTNAYYVSKIFGPGRDSIGGYYFNTIQAAINRARTAGASATNKKTVYIFGGTYMEPCTLKNWVNIKGDGQLRTFLRFPHDSAHFIARGAANFTVEDVSILCHDWDGVGLAGACSLSTASCSSVVYKNTTFSEDIGTANFRFVISGVGSYSLTDSVTLDHCNVGGFSWNYGYYSPTQKNSSSLLVGPIVPSYTYLKNVNINMNSQTGPGGKFALKCSTSSSNIGLNMFIQDCRVATSATVTGTSHLGAFRCMTSGSGGYLEMLNSSFETDGQATVDTAFVLDDYGYGYGPFIEINNCMFKGLVGCSGNGNHIKTTGSTVASVDYPFFGIASFGGTFEWNQAGNVPSSYPTQPGWHYGEVFFDTTKTPSNYAAPHEGMQYYKSNATPNDTLMVYMDAGWRNLDRTWATGRDSVLVNQASDTLAITGIQTTSFVEINLESDPGVNIGCPYHTKTANQDILVWPVACVNKFYYRWRIH